MSQDSESRPLPLHEASDLAYKINKLANSAQKERKTCHMLNRRVLATMKPINAVYKGVAEASEELRPVLETYLHPVFDRYVMVLSSILELIVKISQKSSSIRLSLFTYLYVRDHVLAANRDLDRITAIFVNIIAEMVATTSADIQTWQMISLQWSSLNVQTHRDRDEVMIVLNEEFDDAANSDQESSVITEREGPPSILKKSTSRTRQTLATSKSNGSVKGVRFNLEDADDSASLEEATRVRQRKSTDVLPPVKIIIDTEADEISEECDATENSSINPLDTTALSSDNNNYREEFVPKVDSWLSKAISNGLVEFIPYMQFSDIAYIGDGSHGTVHSAKWSKLGDNLVALKRLDKTTRMDQLSDFVNELKILTQLRNESNVVYAYGVTTDFSTGHNCLVMSYALNGSLRCYYSQKNYKSFNWGRKINLAWQVAHGLNYIHREGIIHGDLHSGNILIDSAGRALITDFGLVTKVTEGSRGQRHSSSVSALAGLLPYIAPEQLMDSKEPNITNTDIYSLGVVFWEITAARPPFHDEEYNFVLGLSICEGKREKDIPGTPSGYQKLYKDMWAADSKSRPNLDSVLEILEELIEQEADHHYGNENLSTNGVLSSTFHSRKEYSTVNLPRIDLWDACSSGDADAVDFYLTNNPELNVNLKRGPNQDTLLIFTVTRCVNPLKVLEVLLTHGADVKAANLVGDTALHAVCKNCPSPLESIKLLLKHRADPNATNENGFTAIHLFSDIYRSLESLRFLLEHGANVNALTNNGNGIFQQVLHSTSLESENPEAIALLLSHGANTSIVGENGDNALVLASSFCLIENARYLLEHDLASSSPFNVEMALKAVNFNQHKGPLQEKAMRKLLYKWRGEKGRAYRLKLADKVGVRLDERDYDSPSESWEKLSYKDLRRIALDKHKMSTTVRLEGSNGDKPHIGLKEPDSLKSTNIWTACATGQLDLIEYFLNTKSNLLNEAIGPKCDSLLIYAIMKNINPVPTIRLLLKYGVDPTYPNLDGDTALHFVCQWCPLPYEPAKILLDNGAAVNAKNQNQMTPLHYLGNSRHPLETMRLLISRGANVNAVTKFSGGIFQHLLRSDSLDNPEVVEFLLGHGADPMICDRNGDPALIFAVSSALVNSTEALLANDLTTSSPFMIAFALKCVHRNCNKSPDDAEATRQTLMTWFGPKAQSKRAMLGRKRGLHIKETDYTFPPNHWDQFDYHTMRKMMLQELDYEGKEIRK